MRRRFTCVVIAALCGAIFLGAAATQPAPVKHRPVKEIEADIQSATVQFQQGISFVQFLGRHASNNLSSKLPEVQKLVTLWEEFLATQPASKPLSMTMITQYLAMEWTFGSDEAKKRLDELAAGKVKTDAARAKMAIGLAKWWQNWPSESEQLAALDEIKAAHAEMESDLPAFAALQLIHASYNMTRAEERAIATFAIDKLKSPQVAAVRNEAQAVLKRLDLEGKPIAIFGQTLDKKGFNVKQYAGKVVMVDFWATWCPPCVAGMPKNIERFKQYHDKGLEIVGISSDQDMDALRQFLQSNSDMTWPQIVSPAGTMTWHPLCAKFGVASLPTVFLIDRNGVCRSVYGEQDADKLIPELLKEEVKK